MLPYANTTISRILRNSKKELPQTQYSDCDVGCRVGIAQLRLQRVDGATGREGGARAIEVARVVVRVEPVPRSSRGFSLRAQTGRDVCERNSLVTVQRL